MLEKLEEIGKRIDASFDNHDITELEKCKNELLEYNFHELTPDDKAVYYYYLGNVWSDINTLKNSQDNTWLYEKPEFNNAIINYRNMLKINNITSPLVKQIMVHNLTNLGNTFNHAGRTIGAIDYWVKALHIVPYFGMAIGNLGKGLKTYASLLYEKSHQYIISQKAYALLKQCINSNSIYPESKNYFISEINELISIFRVENLENIKKQDIFSMGETEKEIEYKQWVMNNSLFLNPLNDVFKESFVCHDILGLPDHTVSIKENPAPIYIGFFNQIKQEFISLRYFFYQSTLIENENHFSDKGNHLFNTLDYTEYGIKTEYLKVSYRMAYSIFDKIAYFLNEYLELNLNARDVSFKKIWFVKQENKYFINPKIEEFKNFPLRGLFFLSKDFHEKGDFQESIEPEAKELANIRNHIEHKYIKLHNEFWDGKTQHTGNITLDSRIDDWACNLYEKDFSQKALKIIKLCREAIIYFIIAPVESEHFLS